MCDYTSQHFHKVHYKKGVDIISLTHSPIEDENLKTLVKITGGGVGGYCAVQ